MDAYPLQLLLILKGELESIAKDLQPPIPEIPDESDDEHHAIMTDNGLQPKAEEQEDDIHSHEEDEKAQELESTNDHSNAAPDPATNHHEHGFKVEELIRDYLSPAIEQLSKMPASKRKRKNKKSAMTQSQSLFGSPSPALSSLLHTNPGASPSIPSSPLDIRRNLFLSNGHLNPSHTDNSGNPLLSSPQHPNGHYNAHSVHHPQPHRQHQQHHQHHQYPSPPHRRHSQPGEMMMDHVSDFSEQFGSCCRRFVTSLFWYFHISYSLNDSISAISGSRTFEIFKSLNPFCKFE